MRMAVLDRAPADKRQLGKGRRAGNLLKYREQRGWRRDELPLTQIEPAPSRFDRSRARTSGRPNLVLNHEAGSVGTQREHRVGNGHGLVEPYFAEVFEFVLAHHRAARESTEFAGREAVFRKERHSDVGRQVEVSRIRHVTVEVHGTSDQQRVRSWEFPCTEARSRWLWARDGDLHIKLTIMQRDARDGYPAGSTVASATLTFGRRHRSSNDALCGTTSTASPGGGSSSPSSVRNAGGFGSTATRYRRPCQMNSAPPSTNTSSSTFHTPSATRSPDR